MSIGGIALAIGFFYLGALILKGHPRYQNTPEHPKAAHQGKSSKVQLKLPRQSRLIKMWNASGAPKTEEQRLGDAAAVLGGKAAGRVARSGTRLSTRAGRAAKRTFQRTVHATRSRIGRAGQRAMRAADRRWTDRAPHRPRMLRFPMKRRLPWRFEDEPELPPGPYRPTGTQPDGDRASADAGPTSGPDRPAAPPDEPAPASPPDKPATSPAPSPEAKVIPLTSPDAAASADAPTATGTYNTVPPPPDWAQLITRVNGFIPDDDHQLLEFMQRETAGMLGYATALIHMFDNCVTGKGLDPSAMQGLAEYSAAVGDAGQAMTLAHRRFLMVYQEIMSAVQRGVTLPYDGRFFNRDAS